MEETDNQTIPVGFNGMGTTYQRQIGPDGEEVGDLIGPDGHLEELPPYSRYPEPANGRRPSADNEDSQVSPAGAQTVLGDTPHPQGAHVLATAALASGAGGIGIATRNPEYSSTDENSSVDRFTRSVETPDTNRGNINVAARDFAEKLPGGKWRRRMRRKFLGVIPYWAICLLVVGLIIVGIVMGAVLGILLSDSNKKKPDGDEITLAPQPTADVDFLSSLPDGLKPLPAQAWTCEMPFRYYSLEIGMNPNASEVKNYNIQLEAINGSNAVYVWGTQPPNIPEPVVLRLVNDSFEPGRGPAWWREVAYDKRVIISEGSFDAGHNDKREWTYTGGSETGFNPTRFMSSKPGPAVGENAWICTWPNVTMEIFIYPNQNASSPYWSPSSPTPGTSPTSTSAAAAATTSQVPYDPTPAYPKVVKFLERRLTVDDDSTAAICEKVKIVNGGKSSEPVLDDDGEPIAVVVTERRSTVEELLEQQERSRHPDTDPDPEERRRAEITQVLRRESLELTDCGCLWWST
ncbi:uncharacterized protein J7T54_002630 [Emericellopsis cladophorae]|uniref:DUF7820 domain-containing protein n=1 Tax=Emericellopsis cladophorae TaxID=2686198 RepID=A0A9Q0BB73_9HYPO|nr:uncharacterized protein J7T54_002630 [Emericellopsis cladophorae]KAI6778987.1 hypothetical protein J7T54_002630 [Emericellopsis cladophorae]